MTERELERLGDRAARWFDIAVASREAGQLSRAASAIERAYEGFHRACGADHPDTANARVERGRIAISRGDRAGGLADLDHAATLLARVRGGGEVVAVLAVHAALQHAAALREAGRYTEARARANQALRRARTQLGANHELVGCAHNELGMIGKYSGRFADGDRHYAAARPIVKRLYGARSREMAGHWHNVGGLDHARGEFARGEPAARRAVEIGREVLRAGDPELLAHEVAHAALLDGLGRQRETVPIYRRALAAYTKHFGRVHYEVASTLHNLAVAEWELGNTAVALRHSQESARLHERLLGRAHPEVGLALYNLGQLLRSVGREPAARTALARALAISRAALGARHPQTLACAEAVAQPTIVSR